MMEYASYQMINTEKIPSVVYLGEASTPVWRQGRWDDGEFQQFIRGNGCGHCCTAMVLNLHNIKIDPYEEFVLCRKLWGAPVLEREFPQLGYQTVAGITKILKHHGIPAEYFGVPSREEAAAHIDEALKNNKQVIFWSHPNEDFPENPFSTGEHYVLAVGYTKEGKILVANSSEKRSAEGVQLVDINTVVRALLLGAEPIDLTWGERGPRGRCAGYVVVG